MTTYIFMLTKDAGAAAVERVLSELSATFPQHDFMAGDADMIDYENSILAIRGSADSGDEPGTVVLPDADEVADIAAAFADVLTNMRGWKNAADGPQFGNAPHS